MTKDFLTPKQNDTWVLASNNSGKLIEFQNLLNSNKLKVQLVPQAQFNIEDAIEDGLSFIENAIIKARHASRISGLPSIADDSGLCIPILNNAPGIYSARYANESDKSKRDHANNIKLLKTLEPFRKDHSTIAGQFICVLAMVRYADDPLPIISQGIWHGEILEEMRGTNGFGYDPIFWLPDIKKSSSELSKEEKSKFSHRATASQKLISILNSEKL